MERNNKTIKKENPKILFYAGSPYAFRSILMWYAFAIAQKYPLIIVSEGFDSETRQALSDKNLFPKLKKIILTSYSTKTSFAPMVKKNKVFYQEAKKIIEDCNPDIIISPGKYTYPFELYLRRIAQKKGITSVCLIGFQAAAPEILALYSKIISAYFHKLNFLPFSAKLFLTALKKQIGHFFFYWILPLTAGELPFRKEPGCIVPKRNFGKSADYYVDFSKKGYKMSLREGVPPEKLLLLAFPYPSGYEKVRDFFKKRIIRKAFVKNKKRALTMLLDCSDVGIEKENLSLIPKQKIAERRKEIVFLFHKILKDWKIFIKFHPLTPKEVLADFKEKSKSFSRYFEFVNPSEPVERYFEISDVIVGFPPASSSIYTVSFYCPEKIILSLDLNKELLGDCYKNFKGIEYIDSKEKLINILKLIKDQKYSKDCQEPEIENLGPKEFPNIVELLDYLIAKK